MPKVVGLGRLDVALNSHGVERHAALLHAAQQIEDEAAALAVVVVVVLNAIVVVGQPGMRIGCARGAESKIDVVRPDLLVPEGLAQPAGLAVAGKNGLVDDVP